MRRMMRRMVEDRSGERRIQQGIAYYLLHTQEKREAFGNSNEVL
jgi:hypothetical protein